MTQSPPAAKDHVIAAVAVNDQPKEGKKEKKKPPKYVLIGGMAFVSIIRFF